MIVLFHQSQIELYEMKSCDLHHLMVMSFSWVKQFTARRHHLLILPWMSFLIVHSKFAWIFTNSENWKIPTLCPGVSWYRDIDYLSWVLFINLNSFRNFIYAWLSLIYVFLSECYKIMDHVQQERHNLQISWIA